MFAIHFVSRSVVLSLSLFPFFIKYFLCKCARVMSFPLYLWRGVSHLWIVSMLCYQQQLLFLDEPKIIYQHIIRRTTIFSLDGWASALTCGRDEVKWNTSIVTLRSQALWIFITFSIFTVSCSITSYSIRMQRCSSINENVTNFTVCRLQCMPNEWCIVYCGC